MSRTKRQPPPSVPAGPAKLADTSTPRPPYEPPRIVKKRSVAGATTQFSGGMGLTASG